MLSFFYFKTLIRSPQYVFLVLVLTFIGLKLSGVDGGELYVLLAIVIISHAVLSIVDPRRVLRIKGFLLNLPTSRERMALLMALGLGVPLLPLILSLNGVLYIFLALTSVGIMSLLSVGSNLSILTSPLAIAFVLVDCNHLRAMSFVALTVPYLVWGFRELTKHIRMRISCRGFLIDLRYLLSLLAVVYLFNVAYPGDMKFVVSGNAMFIINPNFEPLHYIGFLSFSIIALSLPYMAVYGIRNGESTVSHLRAMMGTPYSRRFLGFILALIVAIPTSLYLSVLDHFLISPEAAIRFGIIGAFSNVVLPSGPESGLTGYSYLLYLVLIHILMGVSLSVVLLLALLSSVGFYDVDVWRPAR